MTAFERLQRWFKSQCDGDWEHGMGIVIRTLDNPGWSVKIDLEGCDLEEKMYESIVIRRSEQDWIFTSRKDYEFTISCSIANIDEALTLFCDWAESDATS
jgi:hypothetical protein